MLSDYPMVLTVLAALALCAIYAFRFQLEIYRIVNQFIFGTICGGIAGNLSDRIFREPAAVVDFIDVFIPIINYDYPIFNIADSGIFLGAFGYIIVGFYDSKKLKQIEQKTHKMFIMFLLLDIKCLLPKFFQFLSLLQLLSLWIQFGRI